MLQLLLLALSLQTTATLLLALFQVLVFDHCHLISLLHSVSIYCIHLLSLLMPYTEQDCGKAHRIVCQVPSRIVLTFWQGYLDTQQTRFAISCRAYIPHGIRNEAGISTRYTKDVKTNWFYVFYQIQRRMKGEKDQESSKLFTFHYIFFSSLGILCLVTCLLLTHCCLLEFIHHTLLQREKNCKYLWCTIVYIPVLTQILKIIYNKQ